jgi:hypothetical protein
VIPSISGFDGLVFFCLLFKYRPLAFTKARHTAVYDKNKVRFDIRKSIEIQHHSKNTRSIIPDLSLKSIK